MKQLIVSALVSLVSGIFFALGVLGVLAIAESWHRGTERSTANQEYFSLPPGLRVVEHAHVPGMPYYTIRGVVENSGTAEWVGVSVGATIRADGAQVNECDTQIDGRFAPGTRRAFQIECFNVAGGRDPESLSHEVTVVSARKPRE